MLSNKATPSMPDTSNGDPQSLAPGPPVHPLDAMWYLSGETEALGPYPGSAIRDMIERGSVDRLTNVAMVGAKEWIALGDVPYFASFLRAVVRTGGNVSAGGGEADAARSEIAYAGFWIRLLACIVDGTLLAVTLMFGDVILAVAFAVTMMLSHGPSAFAGEISTIAWNILFLASLAILRIPFALLNLIIIFLYPIYFVRGRWQASPGKRLFGIHLHRVRGGRVSGWLALGRYFGYVLSAIPVGVGFLMIGWNSQKKALHDIVCGTRVVYGKL